MNMVEARPSFSIERMPVPQADGPHVLSAGDSRSSLLIPRRFYWLRLSIYLILPGTAVAILAWVLQRAGMSQSTELELRLILKEDHWLEWIQFGFLILGSMLCWGAFRPGEPMFHRFLAILPLLLALRELDAFLGGLFFEDAYKLLLLPATLAMCLFIWTDRVEFRQAFFAFSVRPGFYLIAFGLSFVVIYAQFFGQRETWYLLGERAWCAKRFVEEGLELIGYMLLTCGLFEERFFTRFYARLDQGGEAQRSERAIPATLT